LASNARILTFNDENFFAERQKISDYAIPVRRAVWDEPRRSEAEARECLRQERITHVLFDKRRQSELLHERVPIARASFVERWFVREYEDEYFILYRLRED
jgi:hypothetical protein